MGLKDVIMHYAESAKQHTGLHYVPSFNDLCTNSADDAEEQDVDQGNKQGVAIVPQAKLKSNKMDALPSTDPITGMADLQKVGRGGGGLSDKHAVYDQPKGMAGSPPSTVWQYIIDAEKKPKKDVSVSSSAPDRTSYVYGFGPKSPESMKPKAQPMKPKPDGVQLDQFDQFLRDTLDNA